MAWQAADVIAFINTDAQIYLHQGR